MPWFANWGQVIQTVLAFGAFVFAGIKAWPEMKMNDFFSLGSILFYALSALVILMVGRLLTERRSAGFSIEGAHCATGPEKDLTEIARSHVRDGRLNIPVGEEFFGDPFPNQVKHLIVEYSIKGKRLTKTIPWDHWCNLP